VGKTKEKPRSKNNAVDVPLYTSWDVARYLRLPLGAADVLSGRFRSWPEPDFLFHYLWKYPQRLSVVDDELSFAPKNGDDPTRISFRRFAELFVKAGIIHFMAAWNPAREYGEKSMERWERFHRTIWRGIEDTTREPVPFDDTQSGRRAERLAKPFIREMDETQSACLKKELSLRFDRVDKDGGMPLRLYPLTRDHDEKAPRTIVLDPRIRFGRPTIAKRGVPTDALFERYLAGDSPAALAKDYDLTAGEVDEAIRYEARPPIPLLPFSGW
jgi:uncharacterized protein (DUF433 family)